jgi:hypothetical protein
MSSPSVAVRGEAREVALAEVQAVHAMARDEERRERLAELVSLLADGEVEGEPADLLEGLLELGLQTGRIRAVYGPGGEQAALKTIRRLPRGAERATSAQDVSKALGALQGQVLDNLRITAVGPGAFTLSVQAGGLEASVRLDRDGARVVSLGT